MVPPPPPPPPPLLLLPHRGVAHRPCWGLDSTTHKIPPLRHRAACSEMYGLLLEQYIRDPVERDMLFHAVDTIPCVRECGP